MGCERIRSAGGGVRQRHPPAGPKLGSGFTASRTSALPDTSALCRCGRESTVCSRSSRDMDRRSAANQVDPAAGERVFEAVREAEGVFMGKDAVHRALEKLAGLLAAGRIPYAFVGAM